MLWLPQGFFFVSTNCTTFKQQAQLQFTNQANNYCNNNSWRGSHGLAYVGVSTSSLGLYICMHVRAGLPSPDRMHKVCQYYLRIQTQGLRDWPTELGDALLQGVKIAISIVIICLLVLTCCLGFVFLRRRRNGHEQPGVQVMHSLESFRTC